MCLDEISCPRPISERTPEPQRPATSMPDRDYYEVLGVPRDASADVIKKSYRTLARKFHPDVNPGDKKAESSFKEVQQAYDVLADPEKRSLYDRYGKAAFEGMAAAGPRVDPSEWAARRGGPGGGAETFDYGDLFGAAAAGQEGGLGGGLFEELLGRVRGGRQGRRGPRAGRTVEAALTIPFMTAIRGGKTSIQLERQDGHPESLDVKIPPGIESGAVLRLRGKGEPGEDGTSRGDLTIRISVEPHAYFQRDGRNLSVEVPVSVAEAILGGKVDVPTPNGLKAMTIPPNSSSGSRLRLKGQGVPESGTKPAGDLFVILKIIVPKSIDETSRRLIAEFAERNPSHPRDRLW